MNMSEEYEREMQDSMSIYTKLFSYHKTVQEAVLFTLIDHFCREHKIGVKEFCRNYLHDHMEAERMFIEL